MFFKKKKCTEECRKERLELSVELNGRITRVSNVLVKLAESHKDFVVGANKAFSNQEAQNSKFQETLDDIQNAFDSLKDDIKVLQAEAELKKEIDTYKSYNIPAPKYIDILYTKPVIKALNEYGIHTVKDLCERKGFDFKSLKGIGRLTAERINKDIQKYS